MKQIKFLAVSLLSLSILALHITLPQRYIVYIPAVEEDYKVRPAGLQIPVPPVLSLKEADQRYNRQHQHQPQIDDSSYHDECWFNNCGLELELKLLKRQLTSLFVS